MDQTPIDPDEFSKKVFYIVTVGVILYVGVVFLFIL